MANLPETPQWEEGVYQIEVSDPVLGGPDGISNRQAKQLASRTSYLKQQVEKGGSDLEKHIAAADPHTQYAPKASPTFTGNPAAPTVVKTDNSTKLATTAHVKTVVADYAPLASPGLTGIPTAPTAAQTVNNTQLATTAFVKAALAALVASSPAALDTLNELAAALGNDPNFATTMTNALAGKQPLDNTLTALSGKSVAALLEYLGLPEKFQPVGTYADGKVFRALSGDGASISELSGKYLLAVKEDGTVVLHDRIKGKSLWAIIGGVLAQATGYDTGLIMSQKAITDALNLLTPLSSFSSGAGWVKLPDGTLIQQGTNIAGQLGYPTTVQFPVPFISKPTVVACFDYANNTAKDCPAFATNPAGVGLSHFFLMSSRPTGGESAGAHWIAIGRYK